MPLRGRVGRHVSTGANCQNWKSDQEVVIALLNHIPIADGGTGGALGGRIIGGFASDALYQAILSFEKRYPQVRQTGFVEPNGPVLAQLEGLASRPPPAPSKKPGQWDAITTRTVSKSLNAGLDGDMTLSHSDVVNIIRSTLSDGVITPDEINDLATILAVAKSLQQRSKRMLTTLVNAIRKTAVGKGPYRLDTDRQLFAAGMVCDFLERPGSSRFPSLDRYEVGVGLLMRIANPGLIKQDQASLCGPAALLFSEAADNPGAYARFAIDLYEKGRAKLNRLEIAPDEDVRHYRPPLTMDHVDWMTMASIRDSENWFLDYDNADKEFAGITLPGELADWFRRAGYSKVEQDANIVASMGLGEIDDANRLYADGYRICLFIGANILSEKDQSKSSTTAEHWAVQRSLIDRSNGTVKLKVFTWGDGEYQIPHGSKTLPVSDFLGNFYGYVAGKP
jgi:hypothetical protein